MDVDAPQAAQDERVGGSTNPTSAVAVGLLDDLLRIEATDLKSALTEATTLLGKTLGAEKVDAFLLDSDERNLVAVGASESPLSARERALRLDRLPIDD